MNRYRELMDAVEPPAGFEDRLSEKVLSHTPGTTRPYRPKTALRTLLVTVLTAAVLAVTAGAAYVALNWDPIFISRFSPTESQSSQLSPAETAPVVSPVRRCDADGAPDAGRRQNDLYHSGYHAAGQRAPGYAHEHRRVGRPGPQHSPRAHLARFFRPDL